MRKRPLQLAAILSCAILSFATLTACGSDSDDAGSTASTSQPGTETSPGSNAEAASLPEGFPSEVPLPEDVVLTSGSTTDGGGFALEYDFAAESSDVLADYRVALGKAGFTVPAGAGVFTATSDDWTVQTRVFFNSSAPNSEGLAVIVTPAG